MVRTSIVIACCNEEEAIGKVVDSILKVKGKDDEVIVVNNGSTDNSLNILRSYGNKIRVISHSRIYPYRESIRSGCKFARGNKIFFMDGDGQYKFNPNIIEQGNGVISGLRSLRADDNIAKFASNILYKILSIVFRTKLDDLNCGYKVFSRELVPRLDDSKYFKYSPWVEFIMELYFDGYDIKQPKINHYNRIGTGGSRLNKRRLFTMTVQGIGLFTYIIVKISKFSYYTFKTRILGLLGRNRTFITDNIWITDSKSTLTVFSIDARILPEGRYVNPEYLDSMVMVIEAMRKVMPVSVFCRQGRGRSVMSVAGWLMKYKDMKWNIAYQFIKSKRDVAYLTREQFKVLRDYEKWLKNV